jgi:hypothetical protein
MDAGEFLVGESVSDIPAAAPCKLDLIEELNCYRALEFRPRPPERRTKCLTLIQSSTL